MSEVSESDFNRDILKSYSRGLLIQIWLIHIVFGAISIFLVTVFNGAGYVLILILSIVVALFTGNIFFSRIDSLIINRILNYQEFTTDNDSGTSDSGMSDSGTSDSGTSDSGTFVSRKSSSEVEDPLLKVELSDQTEHLENTLDASEIIGEFAVSDGHVMVEWNTGNKMDVLNVIKQEADVEDFKIG